MPDNLLPLMDAYIEQHIDNTIDELARLCAQPSISAQGKGIKECAELVAAMLSRRGFQTEVIPTAGNPMVYAEAVGPRRGDRTLLLYNHYDVQPPEPLELWDSPPFELTRREGKLFARGVSDDKGQLICRLAALDAVKAILGELPCRIKFIIEGEEETSSASLHPFVEQNVEKLKADACLWETGGVNHEGVPMQYLGLRGICYVELTVETGTLDAHSGLGGSVFPNAAWRLVWALNSLKDQDERIRIPGFYDDVVPPSPRDLELLAQIPDSAEDDKRTYGLKGFLKGITGGGEYQREARFVPTCTICGLTSGYQGKGSKTVLPAKASAKVDFRLVPNQDPEDILRKLRAHLDAEGFGDVQITYLGGERPGRTDPDDPFVRLTVEAARDAYGGHEQIVVPMLGGSGPIWPFIHLLKLPVVTAGISYPGAHIHAPNENVRVDLLVKGIKHVARIIEAFARG
jgi:acetylornithine deacetylase/succinyl-diaminopimelate desuccinylase-like protein